LALRTKCDSVTSFLYFSNELAIRLSNEKCNYVVTGANGWLGRATLSMLRKALGNEFDARVTALGSHYKHPVQSLLEWEPPSGLPLIVFHYAFLTKDKVSSLSAQDFVERNASISNKVRSWIESDKLKGIILPSSGAVYDHLLHRSRDPSAGLYGQLKYQDEVDFTSSCAGHNVGLIIPRVFNLSGPYINKFDNYALASFITQVLRNQPITIQARRKVLRSYYFIGDLIELSVQMLLNQATVSAECFDIAGKEIVELGELAERVTSVLARHVPPKIARPILVDDTEEDRYVGNCARLEKLEDRFGIKPMQLNQQIIITGQYIKSLLQQ